MSSLLLPANTEGARPLWALAKASYQQWLTSQSEARQAWLSANDFTAKAGQFCLLPAADGALAGVVVGLGEAPDLWACGDLARKLPAGSYRLQEVAAAQAGQIATAWALGAYRFSRYREDKDQPACLLWPDGVAQHRIAAMLDGVALTRDLVNTPANDMGPQALSEAAEDVASRFDADFSEILGDDLLQQNYPAIHAVGRASSQPPRLIDMRWGPASAPKVTLVGKGVCFDSGGLNLKPASGMLRMKKDMGGAATVLGLAQMIMQTGLAIRLRVLIPAVENAIAGNAYRPGDILATRKGLTVEIGNTDAEGRIVLCDALAEACTEQPELLIDCATLTGAARVALGTDLPALFCNDQRFADALLQQAKAQDDPLWQLPLYQPYKPLLMSRVADLNNISEGGFGGAITAALYLQAFVPEDISWAHIDLYAWNDKPRPGRPAGGEAMAARAIFNLLNDRYGA